MENLATKLIQRCSTSRRRIVVVGDIITDHWVHGTLAECQDGCPKFVKGAIIETPGGAANAARCLMGWNQVVETHGQLSADVAHKWRFIKENGVIVFRYDDETRHPYRSKTMETEIIRAVERADAVLLSDYDKGFLSLKLLRDIINQCTSLNIPCVVDAKRSPELYKGAIIKGNSVWHCQYKAGNIITHGHTSPTVNDMTVGRSLRPVTCINHVGAGDCFAAHLVLALAYRFPLDCAAEVAHSAGRVYVQHPHNRPPMPADIAADMGGRSAV